MPFRQGEDPESRLRLRTRRLEKLNWHWYAKGDANDYKSTAVLPTHREMANMAWQAIAAGANGICAYSFGSMRKNASKAEQAKFWPDICNILREIKSMESVLLGDDVALPIKDLPKTLVARAFRLDGVDYLLIVNRTFENVVATLDLPKGVCTSLETRCGEGVYLDGDQLKVVFDGLGYAFLKLGR